MEPMGVSSGWSKRAVDSFHNPFIVMDDGCLAVVGFFFDGSDFDAWNDDGSLKDSTVSLLSDPDANVLDNDQEGNCLWTMMI